MRIHDIMERLFKSTDAQRSAIERSALHYRAGYHEPAMRDLKDVETCCNNVLESVEELRKALEVLLGGSE